MKLAARPELDALCGEYMAGTLRGPARRRFERAAAAEPAVAARLRYWEQRCAVNYAREFRERPSAATWRRIRRDLELDRHAAPWRPRIGLWRGWALAATAALLVAIVLPRWPAFTPQAFSTAAVLQAEAPSVQVTVDWSADRRVLRLRASRPMQASRLQSFELWLVPGDGGPPQSLAVVGSLDSSIELGFALDERLKTGSKLAISIEPAGGSPTGSPTGPIIAAGALAG